MLADFKKRIETKEAKIGILGLGYVGIPLSVTISQQGLTVLGFDIDEERVHGLNSGVSPIKHLNSAVMQNLLKNGFQATVDFSRVSECDALVICVPTPLNVHREPDLSYVTATMETIAPFFRKGQLLSLESTTWPGTTKEVLLPYVEELGLKAGEDFFLVYSPEREDPGNVNFDTRTIPKVVGGHTENCLSAAEVFYNSFIETVVSVSSTQSAEMVKLLENIHRSINIGLVNELKIVADAMGLDIFEIIDAAKTKPFGFAAYYPGPGIGGHCIPIDPFYLTWKAREFGLHTRFIELAGEVNADMPDFVIGKLVRALNEKGKSLSGAKILALGIAYKRDVDDMRESPSVFVMEKLRDWGAHVSYSDPNVPVFPKMREHKFDLKSVEISRETLADFDAVVLLTDHSDFDYETILDHSEIIVDTRGKYRNNEQNVVRA